MDKAERERLVADAILLERAQRAMFRRFPDGTMHELLGELAEELRSEAESGA
jgi:hypothetical protein